MASVVVPSYDQDIQALSVGPNQILPSYVTEILPQQPYQTALNSTYLIKPELQDDLAADVQLMAQDTPDIYMGLPMAMPIDTVDRAQGLHSLSPPYPTEIVPESPFSNMSSDPMGLTAALSNLSTPSPPSMQTGPLLGSIHASSSSYNVATTSSLDSALTPNIPLTSPARSSLSPVALVSPYASSSTQSPPPLAVPSPEGEDPSLNDEVPMAHQKGALISILDTMVRDILTAKEAVGRLEVNDPECYDLIVAKMNAISRMAANINLNSTNETTPAVPIFLDSMTGISEGYLTYNSSAFEPPTAHLLVSSDQSRKRNASEMDQGPTNGVLKREPPEDVTLALPNTDPVLALSPPTFPAMSAIPLSSQIPQSRPASRPSTPQSFASSSQAFASGSMSPFALGSATSMVMGSSAMQLTLPTNPSFSSVRSTWPDQSIVAGRHHHSLSAGSIINPMQMQMQLPMSPIHPGLASGPTSPISVNPPPLNRASRSGSLSNVLPPGYGFYNDTPTEPPLKKAALGTRSARNSTVGSNWYFGNDVSSPTNTSDEPNTARNTPSDNGDDGSSSDSDDDDQPPSRNGSRYSFSSDCLPTGSTSTSSDIPQEYQPAVQRIFFEYLNKICSNLDAKDSKGDHIHQTLMAKKMQRLAESLDFRPFKFRIQAFTAGFLEELACQGYPEDKIPMKKVRNYLWHQPHILRFNEDGKKAKSKGNHIWNIEARKLGEDKWEFRPFYRKLAGTPPTVAYSGLKWSWTPRVWDPQSSFANVAVTYSSPNLPAWLSWKDDVLSGIPPTDAESCSVTVIGKYTLDGVEGKVSRTIPITIAPVSSVENNAYPRSRRPSLCDAPPRRSTSDSALFQTTQRSKPRAPAPPVPIPVPGESSSNRVIRVLQTVARRVNDEADSQSVSMETPIADDLKDMAKSKQVLAQTVDAMDKEISGQAHMETKRLAVAARQVVVQAAANVIADRNVSIGRAPVVPNKNTAVQRVSVHELSDATHDAIVQAVKSNGGSSGVDIIVAAASILKAQAPTVAETHPPSTTNSRLPSQTGPFLPLQPLSTLQEYA